MRWLYHITPSGKVERGESFAPTSLASEGFIHASFAPDVPESARLHFGASGEARSRANELEVLRIDPRRLDVPVQLALTPRGEMPHIVGPIPFDAIRRVDPFETAPLEDVVTQTRVALVAFAGMTLLDLVGLLDPLSRIRSMGFDPTFDLQVIRATDATASLDPPASIRPPRPSTRPSGSISPPGSSGSLTPPPPSISPLPPLASPRPDPASSRIDPPLSSRNIPAATRLAHPSSTWLDHGASFEVEAYRPSLDPFDILVIPGGTGSRTLVNDSELVAWLSTFPSNRLVASVCTGSLLLGAMGRLRGKRASTHASARDLLAQYGAIMSTDRVVDEGRVITGGGVTCALEVGLHLVARLEGVEVAQKIAAQMEFPWSSPA